jgi:hypothetical protein
MRERLIHHYPLLKADASPKAGQKRNLEDGKGIRPFMVQAMPCGSQIHLPNG